MFTIQSIGEERQTEGTTLLSLDSLEENPVQSKYYLGAYIPILEHNYWLKVIIFQLFPTFSQTNLA